MEEVTHLRIFNRILMIWVFKLKIIVQGLITNVENLKCVVLQILLKQHKIGKICLISVLETLRKPFRYQRKNKL